MAKYSVFLPQLAAPGKGSASESREWEPEEAPAENLSTGWSERVTRVDTQFHGDHIGPQNIPDHINHESTALSFLELFLDAHFWGLLCRQTNLRAEQVKQSKPASYYAKNFKPVAVPELKAFLGLRLQMEKCVIKPQYESYWQGAGHNFIAHTHGFREVMERDRFIALWGFLHLVNQTDEAVDKSDKIYKVRPMLDRMLPRFCRYYSPRQQLTLDEGMILTKNRLPIKQYIRDKPVRWGIKSFLLCEAKTGLHSRRRNLHGPGQGPPLAPTRIGRQCCPLSRGELAGHQNEPHAVHGPLLQLPRALPHAEERAGSPGHGHRHAKPQALPQGTQQDADRMWPVRIPVPGSSVCHRLEGPQAHPLPEQLPRPEESVHCEQAYGGPARAVDCATACGGLHQVS